VSVRNNARSGSIACKLDGTKQGNFMFGLFAGSSKQKQILKSPIVSFALEEWDRRLKDKDVAQFSDALKQRWRDQLIDTLSDIVQAENPFMKMRECLADAVVSTAYYNVLMKHRIDQHGKPISAISHPKLSWCLSDHIFEIALKEESFRKFIEAHGENMNDLLDYILYAYRLNHAKMSAVNAARIMMKDYVEGEDWFQQFYISMCIWEEDTLRKEIGIARLFNEEEQSKGLDGLKYWAFEDFVKSGNKLPHRDWQELRAGPGNLDRGIGGVSA
jgi:hypothetical protein